MNIQDVMLHLDDADPVPDSDQPQPGQPIAAKPVAAEALQRRIAARAGRGVLVLPAEVVTLVRVDLPVRGAARRLQALPFALEDRLSVPLEAVHCALHPAAGRSGAGLAAVVARAQMPEAQAPIIPEQMAIPAPQADGDRPVWAIWQTDGRAVVRVSDGTGFAVQVQDLSALWALAGQPGVISLGAPLPAGLAAQGAAPPPVAAADLRFDLRQAEWSPAGRIWRGALRFAAAAAGLGLLAHLGLALADRAALSRVAQAETARVEARLATALPGATADIGLAALTVRLAPAAAAPQGSAFLPLLTETAAALTGAAPQTDMQRLTWDARSGQLVMDVTAPSLADLQALERGLAAAGLPVQSGVATAGEGTARATLRVGAQP